MAVTGVPDQTLPPYYESYNSRDYDRKPYNTIHDFPECDLASPSVMHERAVIVYLPAWLFQSLFHMREQFFHPPLPYTYHMFGSGQVPHHNKFAEHLFRSY